MIINAKLSNDDLINAIHKAALAYSHLIGNSYLLIGKNKKSGYFWFQCYFEKKHFMHLLGLNNRILGATGFYDKCDEYNNGRGKGITIADCIPSRNHNRTTVNEKSSCCADILRIEDAKYMKIGIKDKTNQYVDFTYGYGSDAILGFTQQGAMSFPITLIPRSIDDFVTQKYKVIFVLEKEIEEDKYKTVLSEVKKGLLDDLYDDFPNSLKGIIDIY